MTNSLDQRAFELVVAGRAVEQELLKKLGTDKLKAELYASYTRTKSKQRLIEKVARGKKKHGDHYGLESITDIVGVRLISLFREDMRTALQSLCDFLFSLGPDGTTIQTKAKFIEAIVYYSQTASRASQRADGLRQLLVSRFSDEGVDVSVSKDEKSEYSSVHIVIKIDYEDPDNGVTTVPIEFQVRSVLEDSWAQFDHKLRYEKTRDSSNSQNDDDNGFDVEEEGEVPPFVEKTLRTLKHFLDNSDDLVEIVRFELEPRNSSYTVPVKALGTREEFCRLFSKLGGDLDAHSDLLDQLEEKEKLDEGRDEIPKTVDGASRLKYAKLAEKFEGTYRSLVSRGFFQASVDWLPKARYLYYTVRMEEAYCRMFSASDRDMSETKAAEEIYESLLTYCDGFPPLHFRYSLACGSLGKLDLAIKHMREAFAKVEEFGTDEVSDLGILATSERSVIVQHAKKHLSYQMWRKALRHQSKGENDGNANELEKAIATMLDGLVVALEGLQESTQAGHQALPYFNNVIGFHNDLVMMAKNPLFEDFLIRDRLAQALPSEAAEQIFAQFKDRLTKATDPSINFMNTLSEAFVLRGDAAQAIDIARKIQRTINSKNFDEAVWDQVLLRLIRNSAYWVLESEGKTFVEEE